MWRGAGSDVKIVFIYEILKNMLKIKIIFANKFRD